MVAASQGEFEAGISRTGQTREHALLTFALGIKQMIVLVNKMDCKSVNYSQARFDEIKQETSSFLKRVGYAVSKVLLASFSLLIVQIPFIPISAFCGENIRERSDNMPWWQGPTLFEALDSLQEPKRLINKPLRIPINKAYHIPGVGSVCIGTIRSGTLQPGMSIRFSSINKTATVKSIESMKKPLQEATAGQTIGFVIQGMSWKELKRGLVAGDAIDRPPCAVECFVAWLIVLNHPSIIKIVFTAFMSCNFKGIFSCSLCAYCFCML